MERSNISYSVQDKNGLRVTCVEWTRLTQAFNAPYCHLRAGNNLSHTRLGILERHVYVYPGRSQESCQKERSDLPIYVCIHIAVLVPQSRQSCF